MIKDFKNIAVAMDLSAADESLLHQALAFEEQAGEGMKFYFLHIIPEAFVPGYISGLLHSPASPGFQLYEHVREKVVERVNDRFVAKAGKVDHEIVVGEGNPFKTLLRLCRDLDIDLLLTAKKKHSQGSGILAKKVARHAQCSVCFVLEDALLSFDTMLVPFDFSALSVKALKCALELSNQKEPGVIDALYVLDYPPTRKYLASNYGMLAADWEERISRAFKDCLSENALGSEKIKFRVVKNDIFDVAGEIKNEAAIAKPGLLLMGATGHNSLEDLFLGSVAEKLVSGEVASSVMLIR
jgi:nucleotide-binding universal stress UspA family protein